MSDIRFTVQGVPVPKGRPRFRIMKVNGKSIVNAYTDAETRDAEKSFRRSAIPSKPNRPLEGPLLVQFVFVLPRPKDHVKAKELPAWKTSRPDLDNYVKLAMDAMNEIFWHDDAQAVELRAAKVYGDNPRTEVFIRHLTQSEAPFAEVSGSLF